MSYAISAYIGGISLYTLAVLHGTSTDAAVEAVEKLKVLEKELVQLSAKYPGRYKEIEDLRLRIERSKDKIAHNIVGAIGL